MEFTKTENGLVLYNAAHEVIAEITYRTTDDDNIVEADHTFVDNSLRGQGIAAKLVDALVAEMAQQGKKIRPVCSYVVKKFEDDKYANIRA